MKPNKCKSCGGELNRVGNHYVCSFCGNQLVTNDQDDSANKAGKSKTIKLALTIGAIVLVLSVIGLTISLLIDTLDENAFRQAYNEACSLLDDGNFDDAYNLFYELGNYSDSKDMLNVCIYRKALTLLENKNFDDAYNLFYQLGAYNNSKDMLNECTYQKAISLLESNSYSAAIDLFADLDGYKKSETKIQEAKYAYVLKNKNNDDTVTYNYLSELCNQNYLDSKKIYDNLYDWKVNIVINTSATDMGASESKIDLGRYGDEAMYVHYVITGGEPQGRLNLVQYIIFPDGTSSKLSSAKLYSDGDKSYLEITRGKYMAKAYLNGVYDENKYGTVTFEFYNEDNGTLIASKSVNVSD